MASSEHWDTDSSPCPAQWVKDLVLLQLQLRSQLWLRSDPWPGNSMSLRAAKNKKKKKKESRDISREAEKEQAEG